MNRGLSAFACVVLVLSLTGCGGGGGSARSVKAYCDTVGKYRDRYLTAMDAASSGSLTGVIGGIAAIGDITKMWVDLAKVAPDEIQTDTEAVRDSWKQQQDAAMNGNYIGAITGGILNLGSSQRVEQYIITNCGAEYAP